MHFDVRIFQHLAQVKGAGNPTPGSKRGLRLLDGAERLRKLLSQIRDASITVENLTDEGDKTFKMSRGELVGVSQDLLARLESLVIGCLSDAKVDATSVSGVELVGGGSRMVVVHEAVVFKLFGSAIPLHAKLDDTSAAVGAAMLASERAAASNVGHEDVEDGGCGLSGVALAAAVVAEQAMQAQDAEARGLEEARNAIEAMIFRWRDAPNQKHGELIEREKLMIALDAAESWLWGDSEEASLVDVRAREEKLSSTVAECTAAFAAAEAAEKCRIDEELNVLAKEGDAERAAAGDDEDHDNRKLPTKERMRMVTKNKEEGTELFKGGNWRMAGARYSKALTHAAKFFDLSPDDAEQVKEVKLSLYNNLTMCYIKMSNWDQVLRNTGEALALDEGNAKALFRRAAAHEARKDWDKALADLKSAAAANPDDKGIPKAQDRVRKMVEKEKAKEKKMWGNVFGK
jgi:tetratricopeptide (TPR) repeat protein